MPLLRFYTTPGQLSAGEKAELAQFFTKIYSALMPDFYVNIVFNEIAADSFFVGGLPTNGKFVRLVCEHIAVNWNDNSERSNRYLDKVGVGLKERFEPKGWSWEYHVVESKMELWRIDSLVPPPMDSEAMKMWKRENRAVPWDNRL